MKRPTPRQRKSGGSRVWGYHLISLELGGAPYSKKNLWPEQWSQAHKSDPKENAWHKAVCNGTLTLKQARHAELVYKQQNG